MPLTIGTLQQSLPLITGAQGIAAGCAKLQAGVKLGPRQPRIGTNAGDLGEQIAGVKRPGTGPDQDMLAQHVARPRPARLAIKIMVAHGL